MHAVATCSRTYGYFLPAFVLQREGASQSQLLGELRQILQEFVGTHNFHNFTEKLPPRDPRSIRIIHSFTASEELVCEDKAMFRSHCSWTKLF
ncbi:hypothetical protein BASA81_001344 [Batrachochytrium salamandrivorans]|nr:hypothetical protein BASA81_001344 [Batrachochytrium salamandrivorans]